MINIILAEDHGLVRYGIKLLLETDPDLAIVAEAACGLEVLEHLEQHADADILLTDLHMPEMGGMELLKAVKAKYPAIRVIFLTMTDQENTILEAFDLGAEGYLLKDIGAKELVYAVNHVNAGGKYISADLSHVFLRKSLQVLNTPVVAQQSPLQFSSREMEVLELISNGFTNTEMSQKLFLSKRTIEGHRQSLIEKTQCRNTAALIKYAVTHGLII